MVRVRDGDHANTVVLRHGDRTVHGYVRGDEAEPVLSIYLGDDGGDLLHGRHGGGVQNALSDPGEVGRDTIYAMAVDTTQVSFDKAFCDYGGVLGRDAMFFKEVPDEGIRDWGRN